VPPERAAGGGFDLKVFFTVVSKDPVAVNAADVFDFLADQRGDRSVVRLADRESGLSARTIARRLAASLLPSQSGLSKLLDRMQAAGLVRLDPDPRDARAAFAAITPHGQALARKARDSHHEFLRQTFAAPRRRRPRKPGPQYGPDQRFHPARRDLLPQQATRPTSDLNQAGWTPALARVPDTAADGQPPRREAAHTVGAGMSPRAAGFITRQRTGAAAGPALIQHDSPPAAATGVGRLPRPAQITHSSAAPGNDAPRHELQRRVFALLASRGTWCAGQPTMGVAPGPARRFGALACVVRPSQHANVAVAAAGCDGFGRGPAAIRGSRRRSRCDRLRGLFQ
jgi:MarR family